MKKKSKIKVVELNIPAFKKTETRHGIPLMYVSEKIGHALFAAHSMERAIRDEVIVETINPKNPKWREKVSFKHELDRLSCEIFRQCLKSFLALNNMLSIADRKLMLETLLEMDCKQFRKWMEYIESEGSVI